MSRPSFSVKSLQDPCYEGSESIEDQVGFYSQSKQPHLGDVNDRVGQVPAGPDERFGAGGLADAKR